MKSLSCSSIDADAFSDDETLRGKTKPEQKSKHFHRQMLLNTNPYTGCSAGFVYKVCIT